MDSDGHVDLAVLRLGENVMLRGLGGCRFERANEIWGIDGGNGWTAAFSAKWEEGNTLPTMAFGNYLDASFFESHLTSVKRRSLEALEVEDRLLFMLFMSWWSEQWPEAFQALGS